MGPGATLRPANPEKNAMITHELTQIVQTRGYTPRSHELQAMERLLGAPFEILGPDAPRAFFDWEPLAIANWMQSLVQALQHPRIFEGPEGAALALASWWDEDPWGRGLPSIAFLSYHCGIYSLDIGEAALRCSAPPAGTKQADYYREALEAKTRLETILARILDEARHLPAPQGARIARHRSEDWFLLPMAA